MYTSDMQMPLVPTAMKSSVGVERPPEDLTFTN